MSDFTVLLRIIPEIIGVGIAIGLLILVVSTPK